jgi:hypothetical protein
MAGYINSKAKKEVEWFFSDYETRMKSQSEAVSLNAEHYQQYVEQMISSLSKDAEINIKAITTDFQNQLKIIAHSAEMSSADLKKKGISNESALAIFGAQINSISSRFIAQTGMGLADKTNAISNLGALVNSYSTMVAGVSQDVVGIVTSKQ